MGGSESKKTDVKPELLFNDDERKRLGNAFCTISHGAKTFNKEQFQHFTQATLDSFTCSRLYDLIEGPLPHHHQHHNRLHLPHLSHPHPVGPGGVTLQHFASHLGVLLKGDLSDLAQACVFLASTTPGSVSSKDLIKLVETFLHSYEKLLSAHSLAYHSWMFAHTKDSHRSLALSLLQGVLHKAPDGEHGSALFFRESELQDWLASCSFFTHILKQVFQGAFNFYSTEPHLMSFVPRVPQVRDTNWSKCHTILDFPMVLYLNAALLTHLQTQWKMLFSSGVHGASFSQLVQAVLHKGPTLLFVRDRSGHVFGGFAALSWEINSKFTGNPSCFLFQCQPEFGVYTPTGYNNNFMYLNHHVQTLPNGLGMGGQFEYFGLWIDQSFSKGHSKAGSRGNTTYGSPQLSKAPEFEVDVIEVWGVGPAHRQRGGDDEDEEEESDCSGVKQSILDQVEEEDKAILDLVDRGTISDAIRAEPMVEETQAHKTIISPF